MAVKVYTKGAKTTLSKNFNSSEFDCNGKGCCSKTTINPNLVTALQMIRDHFGKPLTLTRGYTCVTHNNTIRGAAKQSKHLTGNAADFKVSGVDTVKVAYYIHNNISVVKGLEIGTVNASYIHIDVSGDSSSRVSPWNAICTKTGTYTSVPDPFPTLRPGNQGVCVSMLTYALKKLGYCSNVSSQYTATVTAAVKKFQTAKKLSVDGVCGAKTWYNIANSL